MNITKQSQLTENQKQAMMELAHICQERESLSIQLYPDLDEEEQLFYLHSDEQGHLISFLSLTFYEEECLVHAFTHPSHRKKGCFNLLFDQAYEENIGPAFLFTIDENAKDALAVLNQRNANAQRPTISFNTESKERKLCRPLYRCFPAVRKNP